MRFLKTHHYLFAALLFTLGAEFCTAQDYVKEKRASYFTIQVPGALGTYPMALNDSMVVTGYYLVSPTVAQGFLQDADGVTTTFKVGGSIWTQPESLNDSGEITGFYETVPGVPQGFLRYANGHIVTFNPPCNLLCNVSLPVSINAFGVIAGNYPYPLAESSGFARTAAGVVSTLRFSGGGTTSTVVTGLNASGTIIGYVDPGDLSSIASFLHNPDGFLEKLNVPLQVPNANERTAAQSINADGAIAGWYDAFPIPAGGFVRSPRGVFTTFSPPGTVVTQPDLDLSGQSPAPHSLSINQDGIITGSYTDADKTQHGFVREADGVITSFDPPRSRKTTTTSINDSGVIAGFYYWSDPVPVGFLRIPTP